MVLRGLLPRSLAARMLATLILALALLFAAMVAMHDALLRRTADQATEEILAQRLAGLMDAVAAAPERDRDVVAHGLSRTDLDVHWLPAGIPDPWRDRHTDRLPIAGRVRELARFPTEVRVRPGVVEAGRERLAGTEAVAKFPDGSHLLVQLTSFSLLSVDRAALYAYAAGVGAVVLVVAAFAARSVTAPLTALSSAVQRLSPDEEPPPLPERGPLETRQLARRLNGMALRMRTAFRQRALAAAALSHDLMSPIARLKLRAEALPDEAVRGAMRRDLAEMETMVGDVLAYLRSGHEGEPRRALHAPSLARTLVDEFAEAGIPVAERRMDDAVVEGRPVALKRAVRNLLANAARHGRDPWIEVEADATGVAIRIGDSGPGIPPEDLPLVMEPFFRGDRARAAGGGSGLGLPTARLIAEAHGGRLDIASAPGDGAVATLSLPRRVGAD